MTRISHPGASLVVQVVNSLPAMQETWVPSLDQEDSLEKEMATHFSILVWKTPWIEEPSNLQFMGLQTDMTEWLISLFTSSHPGVSWMVENKPA